MSRGRREYLFIGLIVVALLIFVLIFGFTNTNLAPTLTLILYASLLVVTMLYAYYAMQTAEGTLDQAKILTALVEEIKEQRLSMYKPSVLLNLRGGQRAGKYFVKEVGVAFQNEGRGPAINLELRIEHPVFRFSTVYIPGYVLVGQSLDNCILRAEELSVDTAPKGNVRPVALLVANYEDMSGYAWHSSLELVLDPTTKYVRPGRIQVAVSGHRLIGGR